MPSTPTFDEMDDVGTGGTLTAQNAIPLVPDLNKRYGDPTIHYLGGASSVSANEYRLASTSRHASKVYCIFDTGCRSTRLSVFSVRSS